MASALEGGTGEGQATVDATVNFCLHKIPKYADMRGRGQKSVKFCGRPLWIRMAPISDCWEVGTHYLMGDK